jgi:exodeoxyribonuclease V beta subunit
MKPETISEFDPATVPLTGTQLIEASAGTGKTYTLASLYIRLVLTGYRVDQILVVTFTEAATAELRERIRNRLREALIVAKEYPDDASSAAGKARSRGKDHHLSMLRLQVALSGFDEARIFTIHGFCRRVLRENAFESNIIFEQELVTDSGPLYEEIVTDFWANETYDAPTWVVHYLRHKNITPPSLITLVSSTSSQPDRKCIPREVDTVDSDAIEKLYRKAREIWLSQKAEVTNLLETHPGINRRSYSKKTLPRWLEQTGKYLQSDKFPGAPLEGGIDKFTQKRISAMAKKSVAPPRHPFFEACEALCAFPERWLLAFRQRLIQYARTEMSARKTQRGIQFFDDLIHQLKKAVDGPRGEVLIRYIRERYPAALIDEFQDTDHAQYHIFNRIYAGSESPFFLIGDPKQSIYAFRGADIFAYLQAAEDARDQTHTLVVNWRSDPTLLNAVNTLFSQVDHPFIYEQIGFTPVRPREDARDLLTRHGTPQTPMRYLFVSRDSIGAANDKAMGKTEFNRQIPALIAADMSRLLTNGLVIGTDPGKAVHPGHIAVLVRTNDQARQMQAALRRLGIPSVLTGARSVFESNEAVDLLRILKAVAAPADVFLAKAALSTDLFGLSGTDLLDLTEDDRQWEKWTTCFRRWHQMWQSGSFTRMVQEIFDLQPEGRQRPLLTALLERTDGERSVTNLQHLTELLHTAVREHHLGTQGLLKWFSRQRSLDGPPPDAFELRLESDARAVKLVTVHKAKGLEYPLVYVPYAWYHKSNGASGLPVNFHDPTNGYSPVCDFGSDQLDGNRDLAKEEETAESLRLLYVALTRARHQCTVVWGAVKDAPRSPMGRLLYHWDKNLPEAKTCKTLEEMNDGEIETVLGELAEESDGAVAIETVAVSDSVEFLAETPEPTALIRRTRERELSRKWRPVSFSRLISEGTSIGPDHEQGRDHDVDVTPSALPPIDAAELPGSDERQIVLQDFDRGPRAGNFFHAVYENLDFQHPDPEHLITCVRQELKAFGYDARQWGKPVSEAISQTLACPLDISGLGLRLDRIHRLKRFNELEFVFPVAREDSNSRSAVPPTKLVKVLAAANLPAGYRKKLQKLAFTPIKGFMKGFIDLVFEYRNKWYIVDYKSNFLGDRYRDYAPAALEHAMAEHHYYLQYHIYTVALHRYLESRLPDYAFDTHFGGVYYLFIRGMSPELGSNCGVFRDWPDKAMIEKLSKLFEGE